MWYVINVSSNLHATDIKLTGLYFSGLFLDPFLNSSVMFASFHSEGTIPFSSDKLKEFCKWCTNLFNNFLKLQVIYYLSSA